METTTITVAPEKCQQACRLAHEKYRGEPDWVSFYREVMGVHGVIDKLFPTFEQRSEFEKSEEYAEIQQLLAKLREKNRVQKDAEEPTRVITVRLPQSLHEALRHEAHNHKTSMNKLCISKLLQVVADDLIPSDFEKREIVRTSKSAASSALAGPNSAGPNSGNGSPAHQSGPTTHPHNPPRTHFGSPQPATQFAPRQVPPPHYGDTNRSFDR